MKKAKKCQAPEWDCMSMLPHSGNAANLVFFTHPYATGHLEGACGVPALEQGLDLIQERRLAGTLK